MKYQDILKEVNELRDCFRNCRAYFPYMPDKALGVTEFATSSYYFAKGFNVTFKSSKPISEDDIRTNNAIGHWINQSALVRLYTLMEYYGMVSNTIQIDHGLEGWKELDILRRLRNVFAHKSGKYNPSDTEEKKLVNEIIEHFGLSILDPDDFPINIDEVIDPIFEGCKKYIKGRSEG